MNATALLLWIPKFFGSILIWSFFWTIVAVIHNFIFDAPSWQIGNYIIDILWKVSKGFWYILTKLWDNEILISEVWSWKWFEIPNSTDLKHLAAILFITLCWSQGSKRSYSSRKLYEKKAHIVSKPLEKDINSMASKNLNRSAINGPVDYRALVDADSVHSLAASIKSNYLDRNLDTLELAAAMFEYVKNNVTYVSDDDQYGGDYVATPQQTLMNKKGDCDDQAVLMASLLSAVGIKNRMLLISNSKDEWHLATEFLLEKSMKETFVDLLNKFYEKIYKSSNFRDYLFFEEQDGIWLLADTTRNHIADYKSLLEQGFLNQTNSRFNWYNCRSIY